MNKIYIGETTVQGATVFYFMLESQSERNVYGIEVVRLRKVSTIYPVTEDRAVCRALIEAMLLGKVTPLTAEDIITDWRYEAACIEKENV